VVVSGGSTVVKRQAYVGEITMKNKAKGKNYRIMFTNCKQTKVNAKIVELRNFD